MDNEVQSSTTLQETENNEELMGDEELSDEYDELESDDDSSGDWTSCRVM